MTEVVPSTVLAGLPSEGGEVSLLDERVEVEPFLSLFAIRLSSLSIGEFGSEPPRPLSVAPLVLTGRVGVSGVVAEVDP